MKTMGTPHTCPRKIRQKQTATDSLWSKNIKTWCPEATAPKQITMFRHHILICGCQTKFPCQSVRAEAASPPEWRAAALRFAAACRSANIIRDRFVLLPGSHLQRGHLSFRVCVCACVRACVLVCVCARAPVCLCACMRMLCFNLSFTRVLLPSWGHVYSFSLSGSQLWINHWTTPHTHMVLRHSLRGKIWNMIIYHPRARTRSVALRHTRPIGLLVGVVG